MCVMTSNKLRQKLINWGCDKQVVNSILLRFWWLSVFKTWLGASPKSLSVI